MRPHIGAAVADRVARITAGRVAHPAKAPAAGPDVRFEHRLDAIAQGQIGVADDAGGHSGRSVPATVAHCGEAATNSVSPTGRISGGPAARYIERHSRNIVATMLCPVARS